MRFSSKVTWSSGRLWTRQEYGKEWLRISEELGDNELKAKAFGFLGLSDSELAEYEQSKGNNKDQLARMAKGMRDKNREAEAGGCWGKLENLRKVSRLFEDEIADFLSKTERKEFKIHFSRYPCLHIAVVNPSIGIFVYVHILTLPECYSAGAPNDGFLVDTLKTLFRPKSFILSDAVKFVCVRSTWKNLSQRNYKGLSIILENFRCNLKFLRKWEIFWFLSPFHFWVRKFQVSFNSTKNSLT